jgi:hypothetical protein
MKNITISVPDQTYRHARVWVARRDTSISAVVKYILETLPGIKLATQAFPVIKSPAVAADTPELNANLRL